MGNVELNFASKRLRELSLSKNAELGHTPKISSKETTKPEVKPTEKPKEYANPYEEWLKTWEPGDPIPLVPPGKVLHLCRFNPSLLDTESTPYEFQDEYKNQKGRKSAKFEDIDYKTLGKKLKDSVESLLSRAAGVRGLWVDDKNKLRCPPGTPAANQFTDITGSNCFIPTPRTAAASGARLIRRAGGGVAQRAASMGERVESTFDAARATPQQIRELGFERAQEMMAFGGRVSPTRENIITDISGAMRSPFRSPFRPTAQRVTQPSTAGFRGAPQQPANVRHGVWQLGLREQIWRGQRVTELANDLNRRILEPNAPDGLRLPNGSPIGNIRNKTEFVEALSAVFPNVDPAEFAQLFENSIPKDLSWVEKKRMKEAVVSFWQGIIAEAIANPEHAKWITQMNIDTKSNDAFRVDLTPLPPSIVSGGRRATITATRLAQQRNASAMGGVHMSLNINPLQMYQQAVNIGFDKNGRANGVADSIQGDMHYLATHEFGHIAHFGSLMNSLGFDTQNLQRYPMSQALAAGGQGMPPQWQPEKQVGAWMVDFANATNPTGNRSIQLLIDSANNLKTRRYVGARGYTRADLERDLDNFMNSLHEAIENNITDTEDELEMMRRFSGGVYASTSNIETRAEYYAARRLFGEPKNQPSAVDAFTQAISSMQNAPYTQQQARQMLDDSGRRTFGVQPTNWNISGRMSTLPSQPSLKAQAVRRAVGTSRRRAEDNRDSRNVPGIGQTTMSPSEWRNADTISSPNINVPFVESSRREQLPPMLMRSVSGRMTTTQNSSGSGVNPPRYPRKPTYGPMLGRFDEIFDGVKDWNDFKKRYDDQEIVFIDYETTGLVFDEFGRASSNGAPVQIGAVKVKNGQVIDRFNIFVNPNEPLGEWSLKNLKDKDGNPLTDDYLSKQPSIAEAHRQFVQFAGPKALMGVQNAAFDKDVLEDALRSSEIDWNPDGWIDLKDMASMTLPRWSPENQDGPFKTNKDGTKSPSNGLADITKYLGVELGSGHHNADRDAQATAESMQKLINGAIDKKWSSDVLDPSRRRAHVQKSQDSFDKDIKRFESELAEYKRSGISGKMSSGSQKTSDIKRAIAEKASGSEVGGKQTRDYYKSLPTKQTWIARTIEESEPERIAKRQEILGAIRQYATTGEISELAPSIAQNLNGLDPAFLDYVRKSSDNDLATDLRQASIEFHSGVDRRARINIPASNIEDALGGGIKHSNNPNIPAGIGDLRKSYDADIGIHPDTDENLRPVIGYAVHSDTLSADEKEILASFEQKDLHRSDRYDPNLFDDNVRRNKRGFASVYGEAEIILKPEIGDRVSYGNGDAINNHIFPVSLDSADPDVIGRALIDPYGRADERDINIVELLYGKFKNNYDAYRNDNGKTRPNLMSTWSSRDVLILGGFDANEIEEIRIPFRSLDTSKSTTASQLVNQSEKLNALGTSSDEKKYLTDVLAGIRPSDAIPKNIAVRIDDVDRFSKMHQALGNLRRAEAAYGLKEKADASDIKLSITNPFGLNVFSGISFDAKSSKNSDSREILRAKIEKLMTEMINEMRRVQKELVD